MHRDLASRIEAAVGGVMVGSAVVGGGSVGSARRVVLEGGRAVFVKSSDSAPADMYPEEARGLRALANAEGGPPVPEVLAVEADFLVLECISPGRAEEQSWAGFGRGLATLHRTTSDRHGFRADNYLGATRQVNRWTTDGVAFFSQHRLGHQVELAASRRLLDSRTLGRVRALIERLPELIPPTGEPPALLHGDLWSGNIIAREDGVLCLIDPAAHFGFREADVAMTRLFGQLPDAFYAAYEETWPLPSGWEERVDLFNLYHLLNHANLFGGTYLRQVDDVLRKYA